MYPFTLNFTGPYAFGLFPLPFAVPSTPFHSPLAVNFCLPPFLLIHLLPFTVRLLPFLYPPFALYR